MSKQEEIFHKDLLQHFATKFKQNTMVQIDQYQSNVFPSDTSFRNKIVQN